MNVVTRKLDQNLIHPELAFARHVMRSTRDYDFDEILMRCRYARMNGDTQDARQADMIEAAVRAHQQSSRSDSDPAWTRAAFIGLFIIGALVFGTIIASHGFARGQTRPADCAHLTGHECSAYSQGRAP